MVRPKPLLWHTGTVTTFATHPAVRKAWHAVVRSVDVSDRPLPVTLCGEELVVWRGGDGAAHAAPDLCPHRQALLSGGTIVDGRLQCPYHGWQFGSEGRCEY